MLLTTVTPRVEKPGTVSLDSHRIHYDASALHVAIEDIGSQLDPLLQQVWGTKMYRIVMTIQSQDIKNKIKYTILLKPNCYY